MTKAPEDSLPRRLYRDIARVAVTRGRIARRVRAMADEIAAAYGDGDVTILAVLTGSLIFLSDLMRKLPLKMRLDLVSVSSYPGKVTRSRGVKLTGQLPSALRGRHVLIVDDILDSGRTISALIQRVKRLKPASLRTCVLLRKDRPDVPDRPEADFAGFDVADEFLVGYGLDWDSFYRNLPDVCVLKAHAAKRAPLRKRRPMP